MGIRNTRNARNTSKSGADIEISTTYKRLTDWWDSKGFELTPETNVFTADETD
jgi:hypothetical protein